MDSGEYPKPISPAASSPPRHIVSIPYPGRGHINPMINLCRLLSPKTLTITIILTEEWLGLISSDTPFLTLPSNIQIRSIPNILPSERTRGNNYTEFFEAVQSKIADPVQRVLDELNPPADVIVADALLPWIVGTCKKMNVPAVSLWTESASVLFSLYRFDRLDAAGRLPDDFSVHWWHYYSSIGGFLTHCGWNSTLEAIFAGVPMITYPLFWDQKPNSKLVVDDWKIGLRVKEDEEEIVKRERVVKKVRKLMDFDDEETKGMRERMARFKAMCRDALEVGGSSQKNLDDYDL